MSGSFVNPVWLKLQTQVYSNQKAIKSKSSFETRWTAQFAAGHAVKSRLDVILALLGQMDEDINGDQATEAQSILQMVDLKFIFCLEIFHVFLRELKSASTKYTAES